MGFWNMRATGRRVWFVPFDSHESHEAMVREIMKSGRYAINPQVENEPDIQKAPSISEETAVSVQTWINSLGEGTAAITTWQPRYGHSIEWYVGDIHVAEVEAQRGQDLALVNGERLTPVKALAPRLLRDEWTYKKYSWAIEVSYIGGDHDNQTTLSLPRTPGIDELLRRSITQFEARVGERGIIFLEDSTSSNLYLSALPTQDVFYALFEAAGFEASPSEPGIYADQIIRKMGHLQFDCRLFKLRGVREIINRLSSGGSLDQATMSQIVLSNTDDRFGRNWRDDLYKDLIIKRGQRGRPRFTEIFDELLQNQIIRPGLELRCQSCNQEEWYHVSEFSEEFTCRLCFTSQRVHFSNPRAKQWQFKSDGFFRIPDSARGSLSVIASLWRFSAFASVHDGKYITSTNLRRKAGGKKREVDYAYLYMPKTLSTAYQLILGEASCTAA